MKRLTICFIHFFVFLCGTSSLYSQSSNNLRKELCYYCSGHKLIREQVTCSNCRNWNAEYRRKVPCRVCKDSRSVIGPIIKCTRCGGKGYRLVDNLSDNMAYVKEALADWRLSTESKNYWNNFVFWIVDYRHVWLYSDSYSKKYEFFDDGKFIFTTSGNTYSGTWEKRKGDNYHQVWMYIYKDSQRYLMIMDTAYPERGFEPY